MGIRAVKKNNFEYSSNKKKKSTFECKTLHSNFRCLTGCLISGAQERCDEDVGRCHCILMLFLVYPVEPKGYVVHSKYCGKREHQCGDDVCVKIGTRDISRGTSISVALTSPKRESDI